MKNSALFILIILITFSCKKHENNTAATKAAPGNADKQFDLATVNFTEDINTLLWTQGFNVNQGTDAEQTIFGYKTFSSDSKKLLVFDNQKLEGTPGKQKNNVVLHYNETTGVVSMFELKIYNQKESATLYASLNRLWGKPVFEKNDSNASGSIEINENGNEVKADAKSEKKYAVWEDKSGRAYFYVETITGNEVFTELTALDSNGKSAKDWIAFRGFNWYK